MSNSSSIFAGLFCSFALSVGAMVLIPQFQLGGLQPSAKKDGLQYTEIYPVKNGTADQGRAVYVEQGCYVCHSQQVRDPQNGTDIKRGWGTRRTVARDYLYEQPALLGTTRLGPDLANIGSKEWRDEPKDDTRKPAKRDAAWHYLHLYAPQSIVTESNHPPYRYLFDVVPISGQPSQDALPLKGDHAPPAGKQVIPSPAMKMLVGYLLSLDRSAPLDEANAGKPPVAATPAPKPAPAAPAPGATPAAPGAPAPVAAPAAAPAAPAAK